jgi:TAT (twin-arginine translocation) pathway signal sequence
MENKSNRRVLMRVNRRDNDYLPEQSKPWWQVSRRQFIAGAAAVGALSLVGFCTYSLVTDDYQDIDDDTLKLQQQHGWNVGSEDKKLSFPSPQTVDSQKSGNWQAYLTPQNLLRAYQPQKAQLVPFFVPTLIQALQFDTLRTQIVPIATPDMQENYQRGQAFGKELLKNAKNGNETALVVDLPGRDSVAFGAGLAETCHLVSTFDNLPHPLGVTPSHETLAAMVFYANEIEARKAQLPANAPTVFLLDSQRLANYKDAETQFDNRYLAKIPSAQKLKSLGIKSLIYVTPNRQQKEELDDLNDVFVDYKQNNVLVAMLPVEDFQGVDEIKEVQTGANSRSRVVERHYYYGGSPLGSGLFFYAYPIFYPVPSYRLPSFNPYQQGRYPSVPPSTVPPATGSTTSSFPRSTGTSSFSPGGGTSTFTRGSAAPPPIAPPSYNPAPRPTMFSGTKLGTSATGIGRSKPTGFGRATVRMSASSGKVVATRAGGGISRAGSSGRSGSFGRSGGWFTS